MKRAWVVMMTICWVGCSQTVERSQKSTPSRGKTVVKAAASAVQTASMKQALAAYEKAASALDAGQEDDALKGFTEAARLAPNSALPNYGKGLVYLKRKDFKSASNAFAQAVNVRSDFYQAYDGLGQAQRGAGDFDAAEKAYQSAIRYASAQDPAYVDPYYNLGILYDVYLGKSDRALQYYREYVKLNGSQTEKVKTWITLLEK